MRIAVCPGSFDPVTLGHLDIIDRASKLFDKVIVLVSFNANKSRAAFTPTERMEMIIEVTKHLDNVVVDCYNGLLADYLQKTGANAIVKGLRAVSRLFADIFLFFIPHTKRDFTAEVPLVILIMYPKKQVLS